MNPVVIVHLLFAGVTMAAAVPLIRRKVKMNRWYGVRIPAAFESEEKWLEINQYGGRLLLWWSVSIALTAGIGACLKRRDWAAYDCGALVVILAGLTLIVVKVYRYSVKPDER